MTTNLDRAQLVSRSVQLLSVALQSAKVSSAVDPFDPVEELALEQGYRARYELNARDNDRLVVLVDLRLGAAVQSSGAEVFQIESTYRLMYGLKAANEYPGDTLQFFAELNGVYNVWPYWRELVQTVSGRVGIASVVIPVFRPPVRPLTEEEEEQLTMALPDNPKAPRRKRATKPSP